MRGRLLLSVILFLASALRADSRIAGSKHDLSVYGVGKVRAVRETRICIFCHTPHNAQPGTPLWNRHLPRTHYRIYESSTTDARIDQPSGSSKLCLSCHDGSLALGAVLSQSPADPIVMTFRTMPPGRTNLTNDLSDDHPIGFRYDRALANKDPQLRYPELVSRELPLGPRGEVQCTTCHDPHNNELGNFLRITDRRATLCTTCHNMRGWRSASHSISNRTVRDRAVDPRERLTYRSVADNACLNCHKPHSARGRERLLRFRREEDNCLNCHTGLTAGANILSVIRQRSSHRVDRYFRIHDPTENPLTMRRHVECTDCHNPHSVRPVVSPIRGRKRPILAVGPLTNVPGVSQSGVQLDRARFVYEVCYRCHADSVVRPRARTRRQVDVQNIRLEFMPTNPSFHPVAAARRSSDVVSLISPVRTGDRITCIDCHNDPNARTVGGSGPSGPHGSPFAGLLMANLSTRDFTPESANAYALCYRCHNRTSILGNQSFPLHSLHVVQQQAPCTVCHTPHGVSRQGGTSKNNTHLINFDLSVVRPADGATGRRILYEDTGRFSGNCTLKCHGMNHIKFPYAQ